MENEKFSIVNFWFTKSESDFKTIENNMKSNHSPTDAICFHARQAIEKYMKGAFV
ncbi:HEPN domain-containing protein [Candidatus Scalindua japonica]|uniref:HEPN domain-containing protein n=1 Tax=Candidatus Scalindua japonica TaxID=1284222 RepID=UPI000BDFAD8D|nr:HEPN domain-containing protein [Candidatus Scalindua japonica]